jgi:regulator of protease activity HflC (stomatin/prohibitin superfamily)
VGWPVFGCVPGGTGKGGFRTPTIVIILIAVALVVFLLATSTIKIVQEYERGVIFRLGRLVGARGPGLFFLIPGAERMRKVDLRIVTLEVPAQEAITRDNVTVKVNAVVYFRVVDPRGCGRQGPRLRPRHLADRPDHVTKHPRPVRSRPPAIRA